MRTCSRVRCGSRQKITISTLAEQQRLEAALSQSLSRNGPGDAGLAATQPPLYYALQVIPYELASSGTLLNQLELMRLLTALIGGFTALFAFLFLRETLPSTRWAWTVGALGVALMPALGMMSGALNPDTLLFAVSTALFYCFARAFRRGLTPWLGIATGVVIAVGCLTKLTFVALLPGAALGLLALAVREARRSTPAAYRSLALAVGVGVVPASLYALRDASSRQPSTKVVASAFGFAGQVHSFSNAAAYMWQLYLPRLPGMHPAFHGISGSLLWFKKLVGQYGWLDTAFPPWAVEIAFIPVLLILVLLAREVISNIPALRARWLEISVYARWSWRPGGHRNG